MCVEYDTEATEKMRRRRTIRGWKVLTRDGYSPMQHGYSYGPGALHISRATQAKQYCEGKRGVHLFRSKRFAFRFFGGVWRLVIAYRLVQVTAEGGNNIRAADDTQFAVNRCEISLEDWNKAGLPKRAVRRRVI